MNYQLRMSRAAKRDLDDVPNRLLDALIQRHFPRIAANPRAVGRPKSGRLRGVWGYDFGPRGGYRILYEIFDGEREVLIIAIGSHDKAYRRALRRI